MPDTMTELEWESLLDTVVADGPWDEPGIQDGDGLLADLAGLTGRTGPALVGALSRLEPSALTGSQRIAYLRATEAALSWIAGLQVRALRVVAGSRPRIDEHVIDGGVVTIEDASRSEVAAATRWSESWAAERIRCARLLDEALPATRDALLSGEVTLRHAEAICSAVTRLAGFPDWLAGAADAAFASACSYLEGRLLPVARRSGVSATRRAAERALQRVDADGVEQRRREGRRTRDVWIEPEADGMALFMARMGIAEAIGCLTAVDTLARTPDLHVSSATAHNAGIGERRAEALAVLCLTEGDAHGPHRAPRPVVRTHVNVTIDLDSLLGLTDATAVISGSSGPGGPVPVGAGVVRDLVRADSEATLQRLLVEPTNGHLLDRGRRVYAVPAVLREYLIARDVTCRFPGCNRRADLGQADHALPWAAQGRTDRANLGMLCARHHQLKTHAGWRITESFRDGSCRWRSPAGYEYERQATPLIDTTDAPGVDPSDVGPDPPPF